MSPRGLVVAAPSSGAGKTVVTLGLLRALRRAGIDVSAAKSGPDYIDPAFHAAACGVPSINLDAWAMDPVELRMRAAGRPGSLLVIEGAVGVLDSAADGRGSVADLAQALALPLVLVLDVARQSASAALAPAGLQALRPDLPVAGVILNRLGSARHEALVRHPLEAAGIRVLGAVPTEPRLHLPERHLGLVQAGETAALDARLDALADVVERSLDLDALVASAAALGPAQGAPRLLRPLGQRIAVAQDAAFAFAYPHMLEDWRAAGAQLLPFSPLADEPPDPSADAVFLPGGYPELHAGRLASATRFAAGMRAASGARIYGECGGFMALGQSLVDADGAAHPMLGLLPLETSFETRRRVLGYRRLKALPGAPWDGALMGHEFHYASILHEGDAERIFEVTDAAGGPLPAMGLRVGSVSGSFAHVIAPG